MIVSAFSSDCPSDNLYTLMTGGDDVFSGQSATVHLRDVTGSGPWHSTLGTLTSLPSTGSLTHRAARFCVPTPQVFEHCGCQRGQEKKEKKVISAGKYTRANNRVPVL